MRSMALIARLRNRFGGGELRQGVFTLVGAATLSQVIVAASAPIITRVYSPADVGSYGVAASILSVLIVMTCLRYEWAIPLPQDDGAAANVVALCLLVAITTSAIVAIVMLLFGRAIFSALGAAVIGPWAFLIAVGQLGWGVVLAFTGWAIRTKKFSDIGINRLMQNFFLASGQIVLGLLRLGPVGMLAGAALGYSSGIGRLVRSAWRTHQTAFRRISWPGIRYAAVRYRRFPLLSTGSAVLNSLGEQAPLLLLVAIFGAAVGGQYALAVRVGALPITLIAAAVSQVFVAETARMAREEPGSLRVMFGRTTRTLALVAAGPFLALAILAPLLSSLVFGDAWHDAGLYIAIFAPMFYIQLVTSPTGGTLDVLERQDLHLVREILRLLFVGGAAVTSVAADLEPLQAVALFSVAGCLTYTAYGLASWRAITSHGARTPSAPPRASDEDSPP
jgi:O-antigen/teichoic acid export membrane protein